MSQSPTEVVLGFFDDLNRQHYEAAFDRIDPDVEFWVAGREWSVGGTYDRAGIQAILGEKVGARLAEPLRAEVVGITASGDRVALEVEAGGPTVDGQRYENQYHFLFVVRDGRIVAAKEYQDTLHASRVICP